MKTRKQLLPSLIALCLLGGVQQVSASTECVETGGSGDTVNEWGIWCGVGSFLQALTEMEAPAAGPGVSPEAPDARGVGRTDSNSFDPTVNTPTPAPEAPQPLALHIQLPETEADEFVGYFSAVTRSQTWKAKRNGKDKPVKNRWDSVSDTTAYSGVGSVELSLRDKGKKNSKDKVDITLSAPNGDSRLATVIEGNSKHDPASPPNEAHRAIVKLKGKTSQQSQVTKTYTEVKTKTRDGESKLRTEVSLKEYKLAKKNYLKDYWNGTVTHKDGARVYFDSRYQNDTTYQVVAGTLTPLADITNLIAGDISATYSGTSATLGQRVGVTVSFGNESFNATVAGGAGLDFTANGVIQGQHLISTSVSGVDSGFMQGSLFGSNAEAVGGAYEVTKGATTVGDVFIAPKQKTP